MQKNKHVFSCAQTDGRANRGRTHESKGGRGAKTREIRATGNLAPAAHFFTGF